MTTPRTASNSEARKKAASLPTCHGCGHRFAAGEPAWASDHIVIDDYRSARRETRYTCDDCEALR